VSRDCAADAGDSIYTQIVASWMTHEQLSVVLNISPYPRDLYTDDI